MAPDHRPSLCGHLIRNSFRYPSRKDWTAVAKDLKPIYTAPTEAAALDRFAEFSGRWEGRYPGIARLWEHAWAEFVPFLSFQPEIREVIYTTNAIESINARIRKAVKARGHFPNEQAALKCVYMAGGRRGARHRAGSALGEELTRRRGRPAAPRSPRRRP